MPYRNPNKQKSVQRIDASNRHYIKRFTVIQFLGGHCLGCGVDDFRCLQFDHIDPILRGAGDKCKPGDMLNNIYMDREGLDNVQVLCANCHAIKTFNDRIGFRSYVGD